ncbi:hypothetical protein ES703_113844 [subsurface metagenome]
MGSSPGLCPGRPGRSDSWSGRCLDCRWLNGVISASPAAGADAGGFGRSNLRAAPFPTPTEDEPFSCPGSRRLGHIYDSLVPAGRQRHGCLACSGGSCLHILWTGKENAAHLFCCDRGLRPLPRRLHVYTLGLVDVRLARPCTWKRRRPCHTTTCVCRGHICRSRLPRPHERALGFLVSLQPTTKIDAGNLRPCGDPWRPPLLSNCVVIRPTAACRGRRPAEGGFDHGRRCRPDC